MIFFSGQNYMIQNHFGVIFHNVLHLFILIVKNSVGIGTCICWYDTVSNPTFECVTLISKLIDEKTQSNFQLNSLALIGMGEGGRFVAR